MNLVSNLIKIFKFFKPLKWAIIFQLILIIIFSIVALAWPYYFGKIIDGITSGKDIFELQNVLTMFILSMVVSSFINLIKNVNEMRNIQKQSENLLIEVSLKKMTDISVGQHIRTDSGFKQSVLEQGRGAISQTFFSLNYDILPNAFRFIFIVAAMCLISPLIGITILVLSIIQFSIYQFINSRQLERWRNFRDHRIEVDRWNSEMIRVVTSIIFRGASKKTLKDQKEKLVDLEKHFQRTWVGYEIKTGAVAFFGDFTLITIVVLLIISASSWNAITVGAAVTLLTYGFRLNIIVESIYNTFRRLAFQWPHVEKFFEILEIQNDIVEVKNPKVLEPKQNGYSIKFENVTFAHTNEDVGEKKILKALDDVSFEIKAGEVCAIVGRSGAGKTTIINLLLRAFDPDKGKIKIEDVELKKLSLESHRKNIGIVEQEVILQNTTLRENILFGLSEEEQKLWTDERLIELAKITRIDQFFERLGEKPFDAVVGERGIKLSGGQRQRVGIARALSVNPEILIFDEATSSLDGENEKAIHDAMKDAFKNRTVIVIAHRLSTVRHADKIICVEGGKIAGIGTHEELYENCPPYKTLVDIQSE